MNSKKIIGLLLSASMVITAVAPAFAEVTTDKTTEYNYGDSITISREQTEDAKFIIKNPSGVIVLNDAMTGGKKNFTFKIPADDSLGWAEGKYTVTIGEETGEFTLAAKPAYDGAFSKWADTSATITVGGSRSVSATFTNMPAGSVIRYTSDNTSVATISGSTVRGQSVGTAYIKAELYASDGTLLATSGDKLMKISVVNSNSGNNGGNSSSSSSNGSSGTLAGGNVSGSGTAGIYARPDSYTVNFQDLDEAAWAADAINFLAKKGVIKGYSETTFAPNASITRAEFAKLISVLYGLVAESSIFPTQSFTDVPKDAWYFNYVEVCAQLGVVNGYGDGTFNPNALISRQEMAAIIYRTTNIMQNSLAPVNQAKTFDDDADIDDYAKTAVSSLQQAGLISGTSETTFEPKAGCTRAQAAMIMYNLYVKYAK